MPETCNSRSISWLVGSCIPKSPSDLHVHIHARPVSKPEPEPEPPISSLPDDLLLACLARAPLSSLPSAASSCRRFSLLLSSRHFFPLRRSLSPLVPTLFALSLSSGANDLILISAVRPINGRDPATLNLYSLPVPTPLSHPCPLLSINNFIFLLGRGSAARLDTWTERISAISPPIVPRKKFAAAAVNGRIYVAGGSSRTSAVEVYDPESDAWRIATEGPTRRYGCIGAAAGEVLYVAGGLRMSGGGAVDARTAAGTVDAYHVRGGWWARGGSRAVPGGGCIVGACGVGPSLYVIASNAVEFTMWRWDWDRDGKRARSGGEWAPLEPPPVLGRAGPPWTGGAVRFSCCAVGEGRMAAVADVIVRGGVQNGDFAASAMDGTVFVYDVETGQWSRGPHLPVGFRRAGLVCIEC